MGRSSHAACCLNYGEEHPQLLVSGGRDKDSITLGDLWVLDVEAGTWKEVRWITCMIWVQVIVVPWLLNVYGGCAIGGLMMYFRGQSPRKYIN